MMEAGRGAPVTVDLFRAFVFPNRMRELRRRQGHPRLLRLAALIPDIPYIRLSKIERGEVVARPEELRRIAAALAVSPAELLIDIDDAGFDIAHWAEPFQDEEAHDIGEERFAVLLGAALRARRTRDPALTIAALDRDYGLPPVNLSRIENAQKIFARWNAANQRALYAIFDVADEAALRAHVAGQHHAGLLDEFIGAVANPALREERTRSKVRELAEALGRSAEAETPRPAPAHPAPAVAPLPVPVELGGRLVPVFGAPLAGGLVAATATGESVEAPRIAGPNAFGLRVGRATLGGGLPGQSIVVVDPDRYPAPGGLAAVREGEAWRIVAVASGRDGRMIGYSSNPDHEAAIDDRDPADVAAIVSAVFVV